MKVSYNWLKEYVNTELSPEVIGEILTQTGLEVEGIEAVEKVKGGLRGLVIGEVLEKQKHPNADRLSITKVDIGNGEPIQIVCGAPNVDRGQKVVVATVGTTLHPLEGDPFVIKKGKIRGEESNGMICAEDEIGLGQDHDGIMILNEDALVGQEAKDYFKMESDFSLEIGLTPNRTDGMSHVGVARDLVAALKNMVNIQNDPSAEVKWPSVDSFKVDNTDFPISVKVENQESCPRYCGLTLSNLNVGESPEWLKNRLESIGLSPINNVVDITNFVLHELGQPLHAFDYSKIESKKVVVKNLNKDTNFICLDDTEKKLHQDDLMICNGNTDDAKSGMCIAGVFGGKDSGITESTTEVFLESAYFNPVSVRKTSKRHQLHTDASFRFERGVDPNITEFALKRAAILMKEICGAKISSKIIDIYPNPIEDFEIDLKWININRLIGQPIPEEKVKSIFEDLDIKINGEREGLYHLTVPPYRADVKREADIIEEILRIYGYNNILPPEKLNSSLSYSNHPDPEKLQDLIGSLLTDSGMIEIISNSLTKEDYLEKFDGAYIQKDQGVKILNPLSRDLNTMRQTLIISGLEAVIKNQNFKNEDLALYEFGKEYRKNGDQYIENKRLTILLTGRKTSENWNHSDDDYSFYDAKAKIEQVLKKLGLYKNPKEIAIENDLFEDGIQISIQNKPIATIGWVKESIQDHFGIKNRVWCADLDWDLLVEMSANVAIKYKESSKFPAMVRDLSLLLDESVTFESIAKISQKIEKSLLQSVGLFDVYEGKNLEKGKKSYAVRFTFQDENKTLTDQTVDQIMSKVLAALTKDLGAQLR